MSRREHLVIGNRFTSEKIDTTIPDHHTGANYRNSVTARREEAQQLDRLKAFVGAEVEYAPLREGMLEVIERFKERERAR